MKLDVLISVRGEQYCPDADPDATELLTGGTLEKTEDGWLLSYDESALTDMAGTRTEFLVQENCVRLTRSGLLNNEMVFEVGTIHTSFYEMRFGTLTIDVMTDFMDVQLDETGGTMDIRYRLAVEHRMMSENRFLISVKRRT